MMEKREDPFGGWDTPLLSFYGFYFLRQGISALPQTHRHVTIDFSSFSWQKPLFAFLRVSPPSFLPTPRKEQKHNIQSRHNRFRTEKKTGGRATK